MPMGGVGGLNTPHSQVGVTFNTCNSANTLRIGSPHLEHLALLLQNPMQLVDLAKDALYLRVGRVPAGRQAGRQHMGSWAQDRQASGNVTVSRPVPGRLGEAYNCPPAPRLKLHLAAPTAQPQHCSKAVCQESKPGAQARRTYFWGSTPGFYGFKIGFVGF